MIFKATDKVTGKITGAGKAESLEEFKKLWDADCQCSMMTDEEWNAYKRRIAKRNQKRDNTYER